MPQLSELNHLVSLSAYKSRSALANATRTHAAYSLNHCMKMT